MSFRRSDTTVSSKSGSSELSGAVCRSAYAGARTSLGEEVEFYIDGKRLVVEKAAKMPRFTEQDLLKSLRKMKKGMVDLGAPQGKEVL